MSTLAASRTTEPAAQRRDRSARRPACSGLPRHLPGRRGDGRDRGGTTGAAAAPAAHEPGRRRECAGMDVRTVLSNPQAALSAWARRVYDRVQRQWSGVLARPGRGVPPAGARVSRLKRSSDRILTTHTGSLPRAARAAGGAGPRFLTAGEGDPPDPGSVAEAVERDRSADRPRNGGRRPSTTARREKVSLLHLRRQPNERVRRHRQGA